MILNVKQVTPVSKSIINTLTNDGMLTSLKTFIICFPIAMGWLQPTNWYLPFIFDHE
ncbi:hypothetical protein HanIR_Chr13g0655981 [Helianthus annuus]|nr:hypothetical protein HanIR_Chr13g0655981 [Helianthus annuus]